MVSKVFDANLLNQKGHFILEMQGVLAKVNSDLESHFWSIICDLIDDQLDSQLHSKQAGRKRPLS